jgi:hypothetical protein
MNDQMKFPETFDEFAEDFGFKDREEIYTNGAELIPVFRVKQWIEHDAQLMNVANRWIPISERLPKKSMKCLVTVGRFNFTEIATYSDLMGIIDHKIFYQGEVGHDSFEDITQYVKAWMPLPEPYEGKNEE